MIDPKLLRNNIEAVNAALAKRGIQLNVQEWADLEVRRKDLQSKAENLQAERNAGAKQVGQIKNRAEMHLKLWHVWLPLEMKSKLLKLRLLSCKLN
jgi:seryl-tRNA synthetase